MKNQRPKTNQLNGNEMVTALNGTKQIRDNAPSKKPDGIWGKNEEARGVYTTGGTNMKCGWQRETIQKGLGKINLWPVILPVWCKQQVF